MTFTVTPTALQWLGYAPETTPGTAAASPTTFVPVDAPKWSTKDTFNNDQNLRGTMSMDYDRIQATKYEEVAYKTNLYADSLAQHFKAVLGGSDTVTGTADPYTHKFAVYNGSGSDSAQPKTYTLWVGLGGGRARQIVGCVLGDLKYTNKAGEAPTLEASWTGMTSSDVAAPTNTPSTAVAWPSINTTISVGGASLGKYSDIAIDLKREVTPVFTLNGQNTPSTIYVGRLTVSGTATAVYQSASGGDSDLTQLLSNGRSAWVVTANPAGDSVHTLAVQMSAVAYTDTVPTPNASGWITMPITYTALANPTDATDGKTSPVQVQYKSAQSTAY